jgi:hypothetical protein
VGDGDAAAFFVRVGVVAYVVADAAAEVGFAGEGGLGTEGVEVEMEGEGVERLAGEVFVGEGLGGVQGFVVGVEPGVDGVGGDAGGQGLAVGGVGGEALRVSEGREKKSGDDEGCSQHVGIVGENLRLRPRICTEGTYFSTEPHGG